jgi:hypothetical protein
MGRGEEPYAYMNSFHMRRGVVFLDGEACLAFHFIVGKIPEHVVFL